MSTANLLSLLGLTQGFVLGLIILFSHRSDRPTRLLGCFVFTLTLRVIPFLVGRTEYGSLRPELMWLPLYFWYSSLPLLYLYARHLTGRLVWRRDWFHLVPGLLEGLFLCGLLLAETVLGPDTFTAEQRRSIFGVYMALAVPPNIFYGYLMFRLLRVHENNILHYYSDLTGKDLHWLKMVMVFMIVFGTVYCLARFGPFAVNLRTIILTAAALNTGAIYYVTLNGLRQFALRSPTPESLPKETDAQAVEATNRTDEPPTGFTRIDKYIRTNRAYTDPQLTISDLSKLLNTSERSLSRIINSGSGLHFNGYINQYRVERAKQLLQDDAFDHYTMEGIANEAGFNSKATFYKAFKQYSDLSPANFRKQRVLTET